MPFPHNKRHNESKTRLNNIWRGMINRCTNSNSRAYKYYGELGITICEEWNVYENFRDWANNNGYHDNLSIDRIDSNGDYKPSNCRWTNENMQSRNTRKIMSTNRSGYRGVSFIKAHGKYRAAIGVDSKKVHLGYFKDPMEAAIAYDTFVIVYNSGHTRNFA